MKKAILLVAALAFIAPAPSANAVCVESEGGSVRVHSGSCGVADFLILDLLDDVICSLERAIDLVDC